MQTLNEVLSNCYMSLVAKDITRTSPMWTSEMVPFLSKSLGFFCKCSWSQDRAHDHKSAKYFEHLVELRYFIYDVFHVFTLGDLV